MKIPRRKTLKALKPDITPLIDVVFLLLLFFLLSSNYLQSGIHMNLPAVEHSEVIQPSRIEIAVNKDLEVFVNQQKVSMDSLDDHLTPYVEKGGRVVIKADKKCDWESVVRVFDTCKSVGFKVVNLATINRSKPSRVITKEVGP